MGVRTCAATDLTRQSIKEHAWGARADRFQSPRNPCVSDRGRREFETAAWGGGEMRCPSCNSENPETTKFCGNCGTPLRKLRRSPEPARPRGSPLTQNILRDESGAGAEPADGERKTVTALFADIKGSTELMRDLDPEEASAIVDPALKLMIDAAHRYDGYVVQSTGDGIFALFGAPVAHEDHPQRALHAAIATRFAVAARSSKSRAGQESRSVSGSTRAK